MRKLVHTPNLDLIRALAILLVLFHHVFQRFDFPIVNFFMVSGKYGVQLFFVLSGFLIGCLFYQELRKKNEVSIKKFILRRFSRTLPTYFIILAFAYLSVYLARGEEFNLKYLFFLQNYLENIPFFKVSWSLCVEEHFYFVLPFFLTLLTVVKNKWLKFVIVFIVIISPLCFRIIEFTGFNYSKFGYSTTATHFNFDSMCFGVLIAYVFINTKIEFSNFFKTSFIILPIILMIVFPYFDERLVHIYGLFILPLLFSLTIFVLVVYKQYNISSNRFISLIAKSSYSIYLTHAFVLNFYDKIFPNKNSNIYVNLSVITGTIITSLVIGYLFYYLIEKKIMVIREKWVSK
jgi:peptidoglycan/LPS O-acetylase OafA/YrhL